MHLGKKTHKSDLRRNSPEQFPDEIFLLERACDDQNMVAELPESCSFGNCCFGFQPSLFLTLLFGVTGGSVSLSLCVLFMSFELLRPL